MQKGFRIICEYDHSAPFVGMSIFDTFEKAVSNLRDMGIGSKRCWICPVTIYSDGGVFADIARPEICVAENGEWRDYEN